MSDAVEEYDGQGPVVLTCEHASMRLPPGYRWPDSDAWVVGTHWSYDPGVAQVVRALVAKTGWPAVLSRFSRLLIDPNRHPDSDTLVRLEAEGRVLGLNAQVDLAEIERRMEAWYRPYHQAIDRAVAERPGATVFSMHSFTPVYEGQTRRMEIGVLFDRDEAPARGLAADLAEAGYAVALNEPYSGKSGLMYAAHTPSVKYGRRALELELRQDRLADPVWTAGLVDVLAHLIPKWA